MNSRGQTILLVASLIFNAVLFIFLFIFWLNPRQPGAAAGQPSTPAGAVNVTSTLPPLEITVVSVANAVTLSTVEGPPTATPTAPPTALPPTPEPPTATPPPPALPTATPPGLTGPAWLRYLNQFRAQANLPPVAEDPALSEGSRLHSIYMVYTGQLWHDEDPTSQFYSAAGKKAAENGNIAANFLTAKEFDWAFNFWMSAPFHALPMLDPRLTTVGFGTHRDASGQVEVAATLDIKTGRQEAVPTGVSFPIMFPADGKQTWILKFTLPEIPDGKSSCGGYGQTTGAPIYVLMGPGDQTPRVTDAALTMDGARLEVCVYDETTYFNPDPRYQEIGRRILNARDSIVILPRDPFVPDKTYTVSLTVNGATLTWSFKAVKPPKDE
jgi:uncharacterized protein YkwD